MSEHEKFNLDRQISIENYIDPTGKKWEIQGKRGSSLVHARPNPDHSNAVIPKAFKGQWTKTSALQELIKHWLNGQWDKSDRANLEASMKGKPRVEAAPVVEARQTPEESLAALDPAIVAELGDIIKAEEPEVDDKPKAVAAAMASKKKAPKKKATK